MNRNFSLAFFLVIVASMINHGSTKNITHEDLREAVIGLAHMMRENTDKLERHELRDKQNAEQIKKSLALLTKRMSAVDGLKAYLVKLDERVAGLELLISQKDERERIQSQRTANSLEDLQNRLEGWATEVETKVIEASSRNAGGGGGSCGNLDERFKDILDKFESTEAKIAEKMTRADKRIENSLERLKDDSMKQVHEVREACRRVTSERTEFVPNDEAPSTVVSFGGRPAHVLEKIRELLEAVAEQIRDLPSITDIQSIHNETQLNIQESQHIIKDAIGLGSAGCERKVIENKEEIRELLNSMSSHAETNVKRLDKELRDLGKSQSVMVEMADHVLDSKKRLEHSYKILQEVGQLIMAQGININNTLNSRFDGISNDIMDNQNGALANLTEKMEHEMSQVWRQINVMYKQMIESAKALEKLHDQNEAYVNGTTSTMDGMESKVGEITKRMSEVDTNLNYLLGRLSLVTQEFNQIKSGLGTALDKIKASFKEVQEKANDLTNPGPHPVPEEHKELDSSPEKNNNNDN